jgi:hypothetical protein
LRSRRLALIALERSAGFSLEEIAEMFAPDGKVRIDRPKLAAKAKELDATIRRLTAMRDGLRHAVNCKAGAGAAAGVALLMPIVDGLVAGCRAHKCAENDTKMISFYTGIMASVSRNSSFQIPMVKGDQDEIRNFAQRRASAGPRDV